MKKIIALTLLASISTLVSAESELEEKAKVLSVLKKIQKQLLVIQALKMSSLWSRF